MVAGQLFEPTEPGPIRPPCQPVGGEQRSGSEADAEYQTGDGPVDDEWDLFEPGRIPHPDIGKEADAPSKRGQTKDQRTAMAVVTSGGLLEVDTTGSWPMDVIVNLLHRILKLLPKLRPEENRARGQGREE
jgi:hypothetical protein